jgi:hypothetical protein
MKIRDYKLFLEKDAVRGDEHSHLNDSINNNNKKPESRWSVDDDDDDELAPYGDEGDDDLFGRPYYPPRSKGQSSFRDEEFEEYDGLDEEDDIDGDDMQHLLYLLRTMFRNSGIEDVEVDHKGLDIMVYCVMRRRERLKDIIKVIEVANKLKRDILAQYDSEFEMYETKDGRPMLTFNFYYGEGLDDDTVAF